MFFLILSSSSSSTKIEGEHAKRESAHAKRHLESVVTTTSVRRRVVVMVMSAAMGIVTSISVEVDVGKPPAAEKVFESSSVGLRLRSLSLWPRRDFVPRVGLVRIAASVQRNEFVAGNACFAYGASLAVWSSLQPLVDAGPTVEMSG